MQMTFRNRAAGLTAIVAAVGAIGLAVYSKEVSAQGPPGGLAVNIVNPIPVPVRTVTSAFQPVNVSGTCTITPPVTGCDADLYTVPAGKRLVIEYFSGLANVAAAGESVRMSVNVNSRFHYLPLLPPAITGPNTGAITSGGQVMRLYAEPLTVVQGDVLRTGAAGTTGVLFSLSGYLENVTP